MAEFSDTIVPIVEYFKAHPQSHQGPPMLYQAFSQLDRSRLPDVIESVTSSDDMFIERDSRGRSDTRINTHITENQEHHADVMLGLLYLMVGGADEAHDLVLPHSWPCDTPWGGLAVPGSPALSDAAYIHAMLHRYEGKHFGEGGMRGWENAKFWFGLTPDTHFLFARISSDFRKLCENLSEEDQKTLLKIKGSNVWNSNSLVNLFSRAEHVTSTEISKVCDKFHNCEILSMLNHCNTLVNPS